jgi:hypothetical protein
MCEDVHYKVSEYYFLLQVLHPNSKFFGESYYGVYFS